jgi:hypothetical protein
MPGVDLKNAYEEFIHLKSQEQARNEEYFLLREAVKGNFRWPREWPRHIPRLRHNLCKPITERFTTYLLGKGFSYNIDRPNNLEYRENAERAEKILRRLLELSKSELQFDMGGKTGSQLGRTVFKVYKKGKPGSEHACFTFCQPDYFYGIPAGDDHLGDWSTVYYSYPMDILEARRVFGPGDYKSEADLNHGDFYDPLKERANEAGHDRERRIPVLEVWNKDDYALVVGGATKFNGANPYKWKDTGEGYIPYVVIENIRNGGDGRGEADIAQAREMNEHLNYLLSRKAYIVQRWLQPTLVWEGAPQNYAEILANTLGGGGAIPARLGAKLYFLAYDKPNPSVLELEQALRTAILESTGMSEIALQGTLSGSVNTGPSTANQYQSVISTVSKKQREWESGLKLLFAMLLEEQERIGDSKALGEAVINQTVKSKDGADGEVVPLSGKNINGLREVVVSWPGVLPQDDVAAANLEMQKAQQGLQSIYTTLEKLGEEYPDDEIARIRMENQDPNLRGEKVAEQMRAQTPIIKQQMDQQFQADQAVQQSAGPGGGLPPSQGPDVTPDAKAPTDEELAAQGDVGARLRLLQRSGPALDNTGDEPVIQSGGAAY